jgi:hypothetical protein
MSRRFGEKYRLHLKDRRISQARNQSEIGTKQLLVLFDPEDEGDMFLRNVGLLSTAL